jgi:hypothetical protein
LAKEQKEKKIMAVMNKMADTMARKTNEAEKELEKQVMKYQTQKESKDEK